MMVRTLFCGDLIAKNETPISIKENDVAGAIRDESGDDNAGLRKNMVSKPEL